MHDVCEKGGQLLQSGAWHHVNLTFRLTARFAMQHPWPGAMKLQEYAERTKKAGPDPLVVSDPAFARVPSVGLYSSFCASMSLKPTDGVAGTAHPAAKLPMLKGTVVGLVRRGEAS